MAHCRVQNIILSLKFPALSSSADRSSLPSGQFRPSASAADFHSVQRTTRHSLGGDSRIPAVTLQAGASAWALAVSACYLHRTSSVIAAFELCLQLQSLSTIGRSIFQAVSGIKCCTELDATLCMFRESRVCCEYSAIDFCIAPSTHPKLRTVAPCNRNWSCASPPVMQT